LESVYSGVVSLRGFCLVLFLAELNNLELWATVISNAYLEAFTSELVYIIAGPEFKELQGHVLLISKALFGLRSSGARWHDRFAVKKPKEFVKILEKKLKLKTKKGTGPISFHLGMDFSRDEDNTLCLSSTKYVEKLIFGCVS
jgi:hypothetical protein